MSCNLDIKALAALRKRAVSFAFYSGPDFEDHCEDFGTFVVIAAISRNTVMLNLRWMLTDFWRSRFGNDPTFKLRDFSVIEESKDENIQSIEDLIASHPTILQDMIEDEFFENISPIFPDREWMFFILRFKYKLTSRDIMEVMRITNKQAASRMLAKVLDIVKEEMVK